MVSVGLLVPRHAKPGKEEDVVGQADVIASKLPG